MQSWLRRYDHRIWLSWLISLISLILLIALFDSYTMISRFLNLPRRGKEDLLPQGLVI